MTDKFLRIAGPVFMAMLLLAWPALAASPCDHVTLDWISGQVPLPKGARIVRQAQVSSLCEVVLALEGKLVAVYAGHNFVLAGQMFQNKVSVTGQTLSDLSLEAEEEKTRQAARQALRREKRQAFFKERVKSLEALVSFSFGPGDKNGEGKTSLYLLTDPSCSHCKDLMASLKTLAFEARITLKVVIYPVLGKESLNMAAQAICQDMDLEAYEKIRPLAGPVSCPKARERIRQTGDLMQAADLSFVPVVVAGDGTWMVEGNDPDSVRAHLGLGLETGGKDPALNAFGAH